MGRGSAVATTLQEAILKPLQRFIGRLRRLLVQPQGGELLGAFEQDYWTESCLARRLRAHTPLMPNDPFRETLTQVATETEQHAQLLAEHLQAVCRALPSAVGEESPAPPKTETVWRLIAADMAAISALSHRYHEQLGWITDPDARQILQRLRAAKQRHYASLSDLLVRIDSYAMPGIHHHDST